MVKKEQEEAERERQKEEEKRKKQREIQQRKKRMLEAAFDGDVEEMKAVLKEVSTWQGRGSIGTGIHIREGGTSCPFLGALFISKFIDLDHSPLLKAVEMVHSEICFMQEAPSLLVPPVRDLFIR